MLDHVLENPLHVLLLEDVSLEALEDRVGHAANLVADVEVLIGQDCSNCRRVAGLDAEVLVSNAALASRTAA